MQQQMWLWDCLGLRGIGTHTTERKGRQASGKAAGGGAGPSPSGSAEGVEANGTSATTAAVVSVGLVHKSLQVLVRCRGSQGHRGMWRFVTGNLEALEGM
jgi:hypothetical protein